MVFMLSFSKTQAQSVPFITTWTTSNIGNSNETSITIPTVGSGYNYDVSWKNDGVWQTGITGSVTHDYGVAGTYTVAIRGAFPRIYFNYGGDRRKIKSIEQWGDVAWTSMDRAFYGCSNLVSNATDGPNLSGVTNMYAMFANANSFNGDLSSWDVSNILSMQYMFLGANSFNGNISSWDVSKVQTMYGMFQEAPSFNQDMSNWNVGNVNNMFLMFYGASSFNQDISSWNVSNATNMGLMFYNATSFNQNLGSWSLNSIVSLEEMFNAPEGQGMGCDNFGKTLMGWATNVNTANNVNFGMDNRGLSLTATTAIALLTAKGWTFSGNTSPCIALSMDLIDFQAKPNYEERSVELIWVTAKEKNNARFELLRSENGIDWKTIGSVDGNGTVDGRSDYQFTDKQPETKNYYRLNQIDFDGKESASEIRFVAFGSSASSATAIYPNPTNGAFTIASEAGQTYNITDLYGRVIAQGVFSTNQTTIDLTGNAKGLYMLKVGKAVEKVMLK